MSFKQNRVMKVYQIYNGNDECLPQIKFQGKWLEELGFEKGTPINIECQDGKLIITKKDEWICDADGKLVF